MRVETSITTTIPLWERGGAVKCPYCSASNTLKTLESRPLEDGIWAIRRKRSCSACNQHFMTFEILSEDYDRLNRYAATVQGFADLLGDFKKR